MSEYLMALLTEKTSEKNTGTLSSVDLLEQSSDGTITDEDFGPISRPKDNLKAVRKYTKIKKDARNATTSSHSSTVKTNPTQPEPSSMSDESIAQLLEQFVKAQKRPDLVRENLLTLIMKYRIQNVLQFRSLVRQKGHECEKFFDEKLSKRPKYEQLIEEQCKLALFKMPVLTWKERLLAIDNPETADDYADTLRYMDSFDKMFLLQGLPLKRTWNQILNVMFRTADNSGKARTVYMQGIASSGKTSVMLLLSCLYTNNEIGRFGPQGSTSNFWLDNLYGKEIYLGDEAMANQANIQTYLLLMEGNKSFSTEIKYGGKQMIEPKPVIICCNNDITINCGAYCEAVMKRCFAMRFYASLDGKGIDVRPPERLYKWVLKGLVLRHVKDQVLPKPKEVVNVALVENESEDEDLEFHM